MIRGTDALAVLGLTLTASCGFDSEPSDVRGSTGAIQASATSGIDDDSPARSAAVKLTVGATNCTGVLITPSRVLTAAHCLNASGVNIPGSEWYRLEAGSAEIRIPRFGTASDAMRAHEFTKAGLATVRSMDAVGRSSGLNPNQAGRDLAIVPLATAIHDNAYVKPVHIVESAFACASDSAESVYSGYAFKGEISDTQRFKDQRSIDCGRAAGSDWRWDALCFGARIEKGDSGGPLFRFGSAAPSPTALHLLCGINSAHDWQVKTFANGNDTFIKGMLLDPSTGRWVGEFDPALPNNDSDAVPNAYDNCPDVANPWQEDFDMDGLGDACDPCPDDPVMSVVNSNLDEEVREDYGPTYRKPDACDGTPVLALTTSAVSDSWSLPSSRRVECTVKRFPSCAAESTECPVASGNRVAFAGVFGGRFLADHLQANVWVRRCACPASSGSSDCRDDEVYRCYRDGNLSNPTNRATSASTDRWLGLTLRDPATSPPTTVTSMSNSVGLFFLSNARKTSSADWRDLAWDYEADGLPLDPALPTAKVPTNEVFDGVVWTWVKHYGSVTGSLPGSGSPGMAESEVPSRLRQQVSRLHVQEKFPVGTQRSPLCDTTPVVPWPPDLGLVGLTFGGAPDAPCLTCGWPGISGIGRVWLPPTGPARFEALSPYRAPLDVSAAVDAHVFELLAGGNRQLVLSSDGPAWRTGLAVGAIVDRTSHRVTAKLRVASGRLFADDVSAGSGFGPLLAVFR